MDISREWLEKVGGLREPLKRLGRLDKARLRDFLKRADRQELGAPWIIRLSIAAGTPITGVEGAALSDALSPEDIARNFEKLCDRRVLVSSPAALEVLYSTVNASSARLVLNAILRGVQHGDQKVRKGVSPMSQRIDAETAIGIMQLALRLASILLPEREPGQLRARSKRDERVSELINLAFLTTAKCDHPTTTALAVELLSEIEKAIGWTGLEKLNSLISSRRAHLAALPGLQISNILRRSCLVDADFLVSRTRLSRESYEVLKTAVSRLLDEKGAQLPLQSRVWAERFLEIGDQLTPDLDVATDVNLERIATLLLGAWEARNEGQKALHLFDLFGSMSRTAFRLSLAGQQGDTVPFDPAVHEVSSGTALQGQLVSIQRPWVQWNEGGVVRIVIKALVKLNQ